MAAPTKIDFFGFYIDRGAVAPHLTAGVAAAQAGVAGEHPLLDRVDRLMIGGGRLKGFLGQMAGRFADALSPTAPGLTEGLTQAAIPNDTVRRQSSDLGPLGFGVIDYLFDRQRLLAGPFGNRINTLELRVMQGLSDLANLNWGFAEASAALQKRLQQLRVYFVEFYHGRFKDRNGNALSPAGGGIDPFHLSPQLAGQLAHVLVEFTGDAAYGVPVRGPLDATCVKAGVITATIPAVRLNGDPAGTDFSALVGDVVAYAGRHAESATRAQVGALIRGGGLAGINNEVVAEALSASIGGLVKKSSEKVAYETLTQFITDPTVDAAVKAQVLAVLDYLHRNGPKPPGFLA